MTGKISEVMGYRGHTTFVGGLESNIKMRTKYDGHLSKQTNES